LIAGVAPAKIGVVPFQPGVPFDWFHA
jgi:hypothetical protein